MKGVSNPYNQNSFAFIICKNYPESRLETFILRQKCDDKRTLYDVHPWFHAFFHLILSLVYILKVGYDEVTTFCYKDFPYLKPQMLRMDVLHNYLHRISSTYCLSHYKNTLKVLELNTFQLRTKQNVTQIFKFFPFV